MSSIRGIATSAGSFRNDIWVSETTLGSQAGWRIENSYLRRGKSIFSTVRSEMRWQQTNPGHEPPATWPFGPKKALPVTHDEWITCQDYFLGALEKPEICVEPQPVCYLDINAEGCNPEAVWKHHNMWSPRRGHGAVVANKKIFVIGGRAREYVRMNDERLVGGLMDKRFESVQDHTTVREEVALKNDVWVSEDGLGKQWNLVTPGCQDPQEDILIQTEVWSRENQDPKFPRNVGQRSAECSKSTDCYGQAECRLLGGSQNRVCVCPMFSTREHHAVAVQHRYFKRSDNSTYAEDYIYVVGGFTNVRQSFCASRSCGSMNGYRLALDDAWVSNDGVSWVQFKAAFGARDSFSGRGSHSALVVHSNLFSALSGPDRLWIFGGETSSPNEQKIKFLSDVWFVDLAIEPCCKRKGECHSASHALKLSDIGSCLPGSFAWKQDTKNASWTGRSGHTVIYEPPSAKNAFRACLYLVGGKNEDGVLSDVWTWSLQDDEKWVEDFQPQQFLKTINNGQISLWEEKESRYQNYLSGKSSLSNLKRYHLPLPDNNGRMGFSSLEGTPLLQNGDISILNRLEISSISDLVNADLFTILKLRGFDYPLEKRATIANICYIRDLAIAFMEKCQVLPWFQEMVAEQSKKQKKPSDKREHSPYVENNCIVKVGSEDSCVYDSWDGCTPLHGLQIVDIEGLGDVTVPQINQNPQRDLEEMHCRQTPGERYMAAGTFMDNRVMVLGGRGNDPTVLYQDVWARDDTFPQATILNRPKTPESTFFFDSNEAGAHVFEYKVFDATERLSVTPWIRTTVDNGADVSWIDHKKGGPGKGWYIMYVRAIDPGGNMDFRYSSDTNAFLWYYIPPLPWTMITMLVFFFLAMAFLGYFEYRRRKRKAALERYALRRMRRKFKLSEMSDGGNRDWKEYYHTQNRNYKDQDKKRRRVSNICLCYGCIKSYF